MTKSQEVYEAVEALLAASEGGLDKQAAFEMVAAERGVKRSNIAGNYYRHAKKIEAPLEPRKRRARSGPKAKAQAPPASANSDLPVAVQVALRDIASVVAALQTERDEQAALIEEMRRLAG